MKSAIVLVWLASLPAITEETPTEKPPVVPESYVLKQRQHTFANNIWKWLNFTSQAYVRNKWHDGSRADCSVWTPDNQRCNFINGDWDGSPPHIEFKTPFYSPDTKLVYGAPVPVKDVDQNNAGQAADADNRGGKNDFDYELTRSFSIQNSVSSTYSETYELDITESSKETIGGTVYGVKLEEELTETLKTDFSHSESQTKDFIQSRSQEIKETIKVPPYSHYIIRFASRQQTNNVPYSVRGVFDWAFCLYIPNYPIGGRGWIFRQTWANNNPGWKDSEMCFASITDFRQAVYGYSTQWPHVPNGYYKGETTDWFTDDSWRIVNLKGQQSRLSVAEDSIIILDVTSCTKDDLDSVKAQLDKPFEGILAGYGCVKRNPPPEPPKPCPWWKKILKICPSALTPTGDI